MPSELVPYSDPASQADCANERIHRLGTVQSYGAVIVVDPSAALTIVAVSETVGRILRLEAAARTMIGHSVSDYLGQAFADALTVRFSKGRLRGASPWHSQSCAGQAQIGLSLAAHAHDGVIYVELEPCGADQHAVATSAVDLLREALVDLREVEDKLSEITRVTVQGIQLLTGYERVLVYRFDADWNGQAIAETVVPDWGQSLSGLHFSAADIPAQARELYRHAPMRWVADRDATPVPFIIDPVWAERRQDAQPIDLSFTHLRSLSPRHLQYNRNLGINGSMSLSIMHGNQLWGLLVCHARNPCYCAPEQRLAAAALVDAFALRVGLNERLVTDQLRAADLARLGRLLGQMAGADTVVPVLTAGATTVGDLFGSTGAAVIFDGELVLLGVTPPETDVRALAVWLASCGDNEKLFQCQNLPLIYQAWQPHAGSASGVLAAFLRADRSDLILWFRPGETETLHWGVNPGNQADNARSVPPQRSFKRWTETRHGYARPWASWETDIAEALRNGVIEVIVRGLRAARETEEAAREQHAIEDAHKRSEDTLEAELLKHAAERATEERFRFATEAGKLGVWELNLRTGALTTSAVCKSHFGYADTAPFTYAGLREAIHPSDRERMRAAIGRSVSTRAELEIVVRVTRADNGVGWIQMYAHVISAAGDAEPRLAGISLDVTERLLSEERIRQSQRIEAVGRLTAGVTHDFNNVLQSLIGELELAIDASGAPSPADQHIERALQATQRGARLTSHLLSFSRQQLLMPIVLRMRPFLEALLGTLARTLGHTITVELIVAPDLPDVLVDPAHLDSALLNLAINARDAMPEGGKVTIEAQRVSGRVALSLTDTGSGMNADVLLHACEPFYTTKGAKGSGLGLSMVQSFARQSGGELRVRSVPLLGTRIEILLPLATYPVLVPKTIDTTPLSGVGRVIIVDDDADVGRITSTILQKAGFEVVFASSGDEALDALRRDPSVDALITDYAMAGMDGANLVMQARKLNPELPALIITGYAGVDGLEQLPAGVEILRKPFQRQDLIRRIKALLESPALVTASALKHRAWI